MDTSRRFGVIWPESKTRCLEYTNLVSLRTFGISCFEKQARNLIGWALPETLDIGTVVFFLFLWEGMRRRGGEG